MKNFFSKEGKISRIEFFLSFILLIIGKTFISFFGDFFFNDIYILAPLALAAFYIVQAIRRCRDIGISGWWVIIPLTTIVLLFYPGKREKNESNNIIEDSKTYYPFQLKFKDSDTSLSTTVKEKITQFSTLLKTIQEKEKKIQITLIIWSFFHILFFFMGLVSSPKSHEEIYITKSDFWIFNDYIGLKYDFSELFFYIGLPWLSYYLYSKYFKK